MNIGQRNLIANFDVIANWVPKEKIKGTGVLYLSIPVRSFVYEVMTDKCGEDDFIKKTVDELYAYYKTGDDNHDVIVNKISKDLCLNRELIVAVLKNLKQTETIEEDLTPRKIKFVLFYDLIKGELLPTVISYRDYESFKAELEGDGTFRKDISSSKTFKFNCLDMKVDNPPYQLPAQMVKDFLSRRGKKYTKNAIGLPTFHSSDEEEIGFACFYTLEDTNNFVVSNPFQKGLADWLADDVRIYYEKYSQRDNNWICNKLDEIKSKVKSFAEAENREKMSIQQQNIEELINETYDAEELNKDMLLKSTFVNEITEFYKAIAFKNEAKSNPDFEEDGTDGREFYRAIFTLIEKVLRCSFKKNFRANYREKYLDYIDKLDDYDFSDFIFLARKLEFLETGIKPTEDVKKNTLVWWISNKDNDSTDAINPLLCLNMIEAYFDENHPFRALAKVYPNTFELIYKLREMRNIANHSDNKVKIDFFVTEYQLFAEILFNLLAVRAKDPQDLLTDRVKFIELDVKAIKNQRNVVKERAMERIQEYNNLVECESVYNNAVDAIVEFEESHHGYFAKAKTTIEEALYQMVHSLLKGNDVIDKATIDEYLQGNYDGETVLNTVNKILKAYDYSEKFEKAAGVEPLKENRILNGKLMLRLKTFCFIMIADKKYSIFLRKFLKENPHFVSIIEEFDKNSEHNKQVGFEKSDYESLNEKMLGLCENICNYINKLYTEEE